jgi:hypothetical protein
MNYQEYWQEVSEMADYLASEAMNDCENDRDTAKETIFDYRLHEAVDGHQWIIYYSNNLDVIQHSDNEDYYNDNFGGEALASSLEQGGLDMLHCHIAFWCLYADVSDKISDALDEYEPESESE